MLNEEVGITSIAYLDCFFIGLIASAGIRAKKFQGSLEYFHLIVTYEFQGVFREFIQPAMDLFPRLFTGAFLYEAVDDPALAGSPMQRRLVHEYGSYITG